MSLLYLLKKIFKFETRFDIGSHEKIKIITKINGSCNRHKNFILLTLNDTVLKMISNIYFNSNFFKFWSLYKTTLCCTC